MRAAQQDGFCHRETITTFILFSKKFVLQKSYEARIHFSSPIQYNKVRLVFLDNNFYGNWRILNFSITICINIPQLPQKLVKIEIKKNKAHLIILNWGRKINFCFIRFLQDELFIKQTFTFATLHSCKSGSFWEKVKAVYYVT